jgi:hypothetical protein
MGTSRPVVRHARWAALAAALIPIVAGAPSNASARSDAASRAASYIVDRQLLSIGTADGIGEALVAVVSGGYSGPAIAEGLNVIAAQGPQRARVQAAYAGRIISGLVAAGSDPRMFGGTDYVSILESFYNPALGSYGGNFYANILAVNGHLAAGESLPSAALLYIRLNQCAYGGFSYSVFCAGPPDVDTTAYAICDLIAAGVPSDDIALQRALAFLAAAENSDGGFPESPGGVTNANSTGLALAALAALHQSPEAVPWVRGTTDPASTLLSMQTADGGLRYVATDSRANDYATVQATPGLAGRSLPVT